MLHSSSPALLGKFGPALLALLLVTPRAHADDAELARWATRSVGYAERGDEDLTEALNDIGRQYKGGFVRFDATTGVGSDSDAGAVANAAFDASWELPLCRVLGVSGSGQLGWKDADPIAAWSATGSACLPLPANTIWGSYTHGENVRLSLFDGVGTLRDRQRTDTVNVYVRVMRWHDDENVLEAAPMAVTVDHSRDMMRLGALTIDIELALGRWAKKGAGLGDTPRTVSLFDFQVEDVIDDRTQISALALQLAPLRLENVRIGEHLAFGAAVGFTAGSGTDQSRITEWDDMGRPRYAQLTKWSGLYADATLAGKLGALWPTVRYTRSLAPWLDGQLVRDDRLAGSVAYQRGTWVASGEGFVALQRVLRGSENHRLVAGGTALELAWAPATSLVVVGRTEAGHTLTAGLATDPVEAEWELRATLGVQARLTGRWPELAR